MTSLLYTVLFCDTIGSCWHHHKQRHNAGSRSVHKPSQVLQRAVQRHSGAKHHNSWRIQRRWEHRGLGELRTSLFLLGNWTNRYVFVFMRWWSVMVCSRKVVLKQTFADPYINTHTTYTGNMHVFFFHCACSAVHTWPACGGPHGCWQSWDQHVFVGTRLLHATSSVKSYCVNSRVWLRTAAAVCTCY